MLPRERIISAAIESRPNPAIETNDQLATILNKGRIKLSFLMSPSLVDFFLEEVSYREEFLGVQMEYRGSMRLAVFRGVVLLRASQSITGHFQRSLGNSSGGFTAQGRNGLPETTARGRATEGLRVGACRSAGGAASLCQAPA